MYVLQYVIITISELLNLFLLETLFFLRSVIFILAVTHVQPAFL
jgi:hypothetical protein